MDSLSNSIDDLSVEISENQLNDALEIYKTQCVTVVESALFDPASKYEVVFRGPIAYVDKLSSVLDSDQLGLVPPIFLQHREGMEEDSWIHLRGHYMALLEIL